MKVKPISIKDIAKAVNVSVTTVSFVLNGKAEEKRISKEVTQRVLDYAMEVNYTPNQIAKSLRTGKSNILVFMVEDISNAFFAKLARIIERIATKKGYNVIFCSNENKDNRTIALIDLFKDRKVDGYILIPSPGSKEKIRELRENNIPVVLFDRYFPDLETDMVVVNNEDSTYTATKELIANGFSNIGFITIEATQTQMQDRQQGYSKALKEAGLQEQSLALAFDRGDDARIERKMEKFLLSNPQLDGLLFATNYLTLHGLSVLREKFPEKMDTLGIYTFDDNKFFNIHSPSISAIAQPLEAIGQNLMDIMFSLLKEDSEKKPVQQVVLETQLIPRESSRSRN